MKFVAFIHKSATFALLGFSAAVFANANLENGQEIDQHKCYACHASKTGFGNGDMIYTRSDSKVSTLAKLKTMVERCNAELRLDLFPEDEADVAAYLNKQFYKFKP
jgi:mono/diheme cytochrome c family protein